MSARPRVGFIGLGAMGRPMAGHLARAGLLEAVWTRTAGNAAAFGAEDSAVRPAAGGLDALGGDGRGRWAGRSRRGGFGGGERGDCENEGEREE